MTAGSSLGKEPFFSFNKPTFMGAVLACNSVELPLWFGVSPKLFSPSFRLVLYKGSCYASRNSNGSLTETNVPAMNAVPAVSGAIR